MITKAIPRIMIASVSSGSGKTIITAGVAALLKQYYCKESLIYKCGPDYIDPLFHRKTGCIVGNLDLFFSNEEEVLSRITKEAQENQILIIEGAMGLFDGIGATTATASAFHLAAVTQTPIILVVDTHGMAMSVCALIKGSVEFIPAQFHNKYIPAIKGIILNRCSPSLVQKLRPIIEELCGIPVLGAIPDTPSLHIPSRHLGLTLPHEQKNLSLLMRSAVKMIEQNISVSRIQYIADQATSLPCKTDVCERTFFYYQRQDTKPLIIAVAQDEAFCFYYEENLVLLKKNGFTIKYFSPLHDKQLPENTAALYLGGGYPELYGKQLEENQIMRKNISYRIKEGLPAIAECGGFIYLHHTMRCQDEKIYQLCDVLDGECFWTGKLQRFGYITLAAKQDTLILKTGERIRAHEFHYFDSTIQGNSCIAEKPVSHIKWDCIISDNNQNTQLFAGFPHLYFPSCPQAIYRFAQKTREYQTQLP